MGLIRFLLGSISAGLAVAFLLVLLLPELRERVFSTPVNPALPLAPVSFADAVDRTAPAVVSIYTRSVERQALSPQLQRYYGRPYAERQRSEIGSGVIIREDGYILTNEHVVNRVTNISVALWDGRYAAAEVVGADPATDLAVLKIDLEGLPEAPLAVDTRPRVGDVVLAIGNALGLSHTVTLGIVSATGRNDLRALLYEDFIQTDAAINVGNSGGALVNVDGEVIGINTRNLGQDVGGQNIGFAIPIAIARSVMQQIIDHGAVRRGWLGANFMDLPLSVQADGSAVRRGVRVRDVDPRGPAWNANLRTGDILLAVNGADTNDARSTLLAISRMAPGDEVSLLVQRDSSLFESYATLIQQPPLR
ncbi:MAG: trypsin-like peptidase domain-containing protein [Pseudomonadota bacterium]